MYRSGIHSVVPGPRDIQMLNGSQYLRPMELLAGKRVRSIRVLHIWS